MKVLATLKKTMKPVLFKHVQCDANLAEKLGLSSLRWASSPLILCVIFMRLINKGTTLLFHMSVVVIYVRFVK